MGAIFQSLGRTVLVGVALLIVLVAIVAITSALRWNGKVTKKMFETGVAWIRAKMPSKSE